MIQIIIFSAFAGYIILGIVYVILWIAGQDYTAGMISLVISFVQLFFYIWNSLHLMILMSKRHDFEFKKKKRNMICIFVTVFVLLAIQITFQYLIIHIENSDHLNDNDAQFSATIYEIAVSFVVLLLFSLIVKFKSSKDCL